MKSREASAGRRPVWDVLGIGARLLLVCAVVAAVVSGVNALTADRYQENLTEEKRQAIVRIFGSDTVTYRTLSGEDAAEPVYEVLEGDRVVGYCVELASPGFGGDISMTVGFEADGKILGVSIVSLSETPGLGSRVQEAVYLDQYKGQSGTLTLGEDVDAIAGATVSSRAVTDGVNRAVEILNRTVKGGEAQ